MAGDIKTAPEIVDKAPGEEITRTMEFTNSGLASGESIASISSVDVAPTGAGHLNISAQAFSGTQVQLTMDQGVVNTLYEITVTVVTDATTPQTVIGVGRVRVEEE